MEKNNKPARRGFFAGLGVLAAAAVATKALTQTAAAPLSALPAEPEGNSYRLTEHVKKYYRTTTI